MPYGASYGSTAASVHVSVNRVVGVIVGKSLRVRNPLNNGSLVVIDHNLAFDPEFSARDFVQLHVFAEDIPLLFSDFLARDAYLERLETALGIWDDACGNIPESWYFVDAERTIPLDLSLTDIRSLLDRAFNDTFWLLPP